jgi:acetyltransferase-like isoleucine patch superfamily enzyme
LTIYQAKFLRESNCLNRTQGIEIVQLKLKLMASIMRNIYNYWGRIKYKGFIKTINWIVKRPFFFFFKFLFKKCNKIYISGSFQIRGAKYIEVNSFSAGSRIRIDAIDKFNDQIFSPSIKIGDNFITNNDIHIACTGRIEIGNNVLLGSNIYITDHDHGIYANSSDIQYSSPFEQPGLRHLNSDGYVIIGDNVFIGEYVTILKNVEIGEGCIIGAHSLVTKNISPYSIAAGNPARVIKKYNFQIGAWENFE